MKAASINVPRHEAYVPHVRHWIRGLLDKHPQAGDAEVCTSELMSNSLLHADGTRVAITVVDTGNVIWGEVVDEGSAERVPRLADAYADADAESGRGLFLVENLATTWGTTPCDNGSRMTYFLIIRSADDATPPRP